MNKKFIKNNYKIMKLENKKIIMKINFILLIITYKKMPYIKFSPQAPKVVELALNTGEKERDKHVLEEREKE